MKVECVKDKLKDAVAQVERFASRNTSLPALQSILITAKGKTITLRATNLDIGIEREIGVKTEEEGIVAVPAQTLSHFLGTLPPGGNIKITSTGGNLTLVTEKTKTTIKCVPSDEFPTLPILEEGTHLTLPIKKLIDGITSVIYSASLSDIKPELSSIYIHPEGENLIFVATDSFRLAEKKIQTENIPKFNGIIIPLKNIQEISRALAFHTGDTEILFNKNQCTLSFDGVYITTRIIDGVFPDYKQIIPKEFSTEAVVLKEDFISAIKTTTVFSNKLNQLVFTLHPKQKEFFVETKNSDIGESKLSLDGALSGESVDILLNHRYVADCLQNIHQDSVSIHTTGIQKPVVFRAVGDTSFTYLVMPMNR